MPATDIDGIATHYEVRGDGPPLLMFSPGGFSATLANWTSFSIYARLGLVDQLAKSYTCVMFDRRESGLSGGRVERITWADYAAQGKGLLDHLGIERAHLMGGCVGCSVAAVFAAAWPARALSMVLYSPAGGARYRIAQHARFARHLSFVAERSIPSVVDLALSSSAGFTQDPRVGPWVSVLRRDPAFADAYRSLDRSRYEALVAGMARTLFDRDTVPGPEPEDLLRLDVPALIVPGQDASHATSAARYLEECLPRAEYWDMPVPGQTEETAPARVLEFLGSVETAPSDLDRAQRLAAFEGGDLVQPVGVPAALERGGEPQAGDQLGQGRGDDLRAEDEHVRVVVRAGDLRGEQVMADPGPDAVDLVAGDLLAGTGAADHDAPVGFFRRHFPADRGAQRRVVDGLGAVGAEVVDLVALVREPPDEVLLQCDAVVVGGDHDPHVPFLLRGDRGGYAVRWWVPVAKMSSAATALPRILWSTAYRTSWSIIVRFGAMP